MRRISLLAALLAGRLVAARSERAEEVQAGRPASAGGEQEPPEEDDSLKPKEYSFNPLEAERDFKIGTYYFKKGSYKAAASRFLDATRWNPTYAEAFLRLGESEEKLKDKTAAQAAYTKYLELAPDAKDAESIKKKLANKR